MPSRVRLGLVQTIARRKTMQVRAKWGLATALVVAAVVIGVAALMRNGSGRRKPFRIAVVTWVGHGPFYLAREKGFYREQGLDVEISKIEEIGARRTALGAGKLEGIISSVDAFANSAPSGLAAVKVLKLMDSDGGDGILVRKGIKSLADLKGKTVAFPKGTPSHFFLLYLLRQEGLSSKSIEPRYMEAGHAGTAFIAGKVDAAVTWEPWLTQAIQKTDGKVLATTKENPGLIVDTFIVREDVMKERPEDVKKFLRGWFKAIEYWRQHPEEANKIMAQSLGIGLEDLQGMLQGVKYADLMENRRYFGTPDEPGPYAKVFTAAEEVWIEEGMIEKKVESWEVTDSSFLFEIDK
jgi:NitT/TauT family transport system substrate-binding protein